MGTTRRTTLLDETIYALSNSGKSALNVLWVGSRNGKYALSWEEFTQISQVVYDSGYGGQEIATDLVVVGEDWWLERGEYDGSEWWEFKTTPKRQPDAKRFSLVKSRGFACWRSVADLATQGAEEEEVA